MAGDLDVSDGASPDDAGPTAWHQVAGGPPPPPEGRIE